MSEVWRCPCTKTEVVAKNTSDLSAITCLRCKGPLIKVQEEEELERATFYIWPEQSIQLEEIKLILKKRGVKSDKSALVRAAIAILMDTGLEKIEQCLVRKERKQNEVHSV